jgi:hypothetical protein
MYPLGHVAIGYSASSFIARSRKQKLILWAAFTASALPDFDILFVRFGIPHESYTHTLLLWAPILIMLATWKRDSIPYIGALLTHFILDMLVGPVRIVFPVSSITLTLNMGMSNVPDAFIETCAFALMIFVMNRNQDMERMFSKNYQNKPMIIPFITMVGATLISASRIGFWYLEGPKYANLSLALIIITIGHSLLTVIMGYSFLRSLKAPRSAIP